MYNNLMHKDKDVPEMVAGSDVTTRPLTKVRNEPAGIGETAVNETVSPADGGPQGLPYEGAYGIGSPRLTYWDGSPHCGSSQVQTLPLVVKYGKAVNGSGGLLAGHLTMNMDASVKTELASSG